MRRWLLLILLAVLVAGVYVRMPARFAAFALEDRLDPMALDDIHGTAWDGDSRHTWWGDWPVGHMRWQADSLSALGGTIRANLQFDMPKNQRMRMHVEQRLRILEVTALRADLVGDALRKVFLRAELLPIGTVHLDVERARFDDGIPVALRGRATWRQATLIGPRTRLPYYLGDLKIDFRVDRPGIVFGTIHDVGGAMQVAGNMSADAIGFRIELHFVPRDPQLAQGLTRLGRAQPDGSRLLILQDAWWWKRQHD